MEFPDIVPITYTIAGSSEHSGRYVAENILVDIPEEQSSRWSGAYQAGNVKQWMLLKTNELCVLKSITFGKFHRAHPCNMKEFKLYVGVTESNMTEVLHAGLRNDPVPETFVIRHTNNAGVPFPTQFIKIVPLSAHGQSFHTSIWYVALKGILDKLFVEQVRLEHEEHQEMVILRHVLKHLRQRRLLTPYQEILSQAVSADMSDPFEYPLLTQLHKSLVLQGDYPQSESLLSSCASEGIFTEAILQFQPSAEWTRIDDENSNSDEGMHTDEQTDTHTKPSARGGHAMCLDRVNSLIYMYGGWNGERNLDDFWIWSISERRWTQIPTSRDLGQVHPGPRACHKMVFDDNTGDVYLFGRLYEGTSVDHLPYHTAIATTGLSPTPSETAIPEGSSEAIISPSPPSPAVTSHSLAHEWSSAYASEFLRYHTRGEKRGQWELLSENTAAEGGPPLIFDHQMVIDIASQIIYVYGGRVSDGDLGSFKYSGLYSYDIKANQWKTINCPDTSSTHPFIPSRFGHSMVLESTTQTLLIFAGQRDEGYLADMYAYHIPSNTVTELFTNFSVVGGPDACFTQRALIDPELKEVYVLCGLTKGPPGSLSVLEKDCPYWIYRYKRPDQPGTWTKILPPSTSPEASSPKPTPLPRYAAQAVYDNRTKVIYMHGGNAGLGKDEEGRRSSVAVEGDTSSTRDATVGSDSGQDSTERTTGGDADEHRLDDFWTLQLKRTDHTEIVRRGKLILRQQRFREMCEDEVPVKALNYLKTDVSSVVDHSNPDEATLFRSLLSHLLNPPSVPPAKSINGPSGSSRARKRSRPDSPNEPEQDVPMPDVEAQRPDEFVAPEPRSTSLRLFEEDPREAGVRGHASAPSAVRYRQRTQVFEELLKFVNEDMKQPELDLLQLINVDQIGAEP